MSTVAQTGHVGGAAPGTNRTSSAASFNGPFRLANTPVQTVAPAVKTVVAQLAKYLAEAKEMIDTPEQQVEQLFKLFLQKSPTGQQRFTNAELRHFLPLVVLSAGYDGKGPPALASLMSGFFSKLAVPAKADHATVARAVHAYYRRYPANRELERQFFSYCRSQANGELDPKHVRKYAKAVSAAPAKARPQNAMRPPAPPPVSKPSIFGALGRFLKGAD